LFLAVYGGTRNGRTVLFFVWLVSKSSIYIVVKLITYTLTHVGNNFSYCCYSSSRKAGIPRKQFPRSILADTPDIFARMLRGCRANRATSPSSLPRDWLVGGMRSAARLSVCCVVLRIPRARHARLVADILARMSRGCYEETARVEFQPA